MSFPKISEYINNRQPNLALNALLETWASFNQSLTAGDYSFADFQIQMGPSLAEAFLPQYASDHHRCLILQSYRSDRQSTLAKFHGLRACINNSRRRFGQEVKPPIFQTLENQMKLCEAVAELDTDGSEAAFDKLLQNAYQQFSFGVWDEAAFEDKGTRSAAFHQLQANNSGNDIAQKIDGWVQRRGLSWRDPRVAYVVDALQSLIDAKGCSRRGIPKSPDEWHPGQTWLLLALDEPTKSTSCVDGLLLALQIEVLANGCGAFYPCPSFAGHHMLDESFQQAFYDAWRLECEFSLGHRQTAFDYRWSLVVMDDSHTVKKLDDQTKEKLVRSRTPIRHRLRSQLLFTPLQESSASLGIAAGLRSSIRQTALDRFRASSAAFKPMQSPANRKANSLTRVSSAPPLNPLLETVGSLDAKQHALIDPDRQQKLNAIRKIVTAVGQSSHSSSLEIELVPCRDFETGYRELSLGGQFEDRLRQHMFEKGKRYFQHNCLMEEESLAHVEDAPLSLQDERLGSYQLNQLSRVLPRKEQSYFADPISHADGQGREIKRRLNERGQLRLLSGNHRSATHPKAGWRQVRLIADSGIGKTTLLHRILLQMANRRSPCIPILLEGLSEYLKVDSAEAFLDRVFDHLFRDLCDSKDEQNPGNRQHYRSHFMDLANRGGVCFLCDALDQTDEKGLNIGSIIDSLRHSRFMVTMRREALTKLVTKETEWDTIFVHPFSKAMAKRYLGKHFRLFFALVGADAEQRKVLTIPLILYLLKRFAKAGKLPRKREDLPNENDFSNRYGIFNQVICGEKGLIAKGFESLKKKAPDFRRLLGSRDRATQLLEQMSFWQIQRHHFDVHLRDNMLRKWLEACKSAIHGQAVDEDVLRVFIEGLNLVTLGSILEEQGVSSLAWRHRSFPEFLAGRHLANLAMSDDSHERGQALETIRDLSDCLKRDQDGQHRDNLRADWYWTLRMALNHEYVSRGRRGEVSRLAEWLISYGNPYVVYDAIVEDGVKVNPDLEQLVRWLVHWTWDSKDYSDAYTNKTEDGEQEIPPELNEHLANLLVPMFERRYRNGPVLPAAWVLLEEFAKIDAAPFREAQTYFFSDLKSDETPAPSVESWQSAEFVDIPSKIWPKEKAQGFAKLDDGSFEFQFGEFGKQTAKRLSAFQLSRYTISNAEYEWMDPAHRYNRSSRSEDPDQPAVNVSWYMSNLYGVWLTGNLRKFEPNSCREYRLPNEVEIEFAIRGGSIGKYPTNHLGHEDDDRMRFKSAARRVVNPMGRHYKRKRGEGNMNGFGVVHPISGVWIWAENQWDDTERTGMSGNLGSSLMSGDRTKRGGKCRHNRGAFIWVPCRDCSRPNNLSSDIGFRLMCILR